MRTDVSTILTIVASDVHTAAASECVMRLVSMIRLSSSILWDANEGQVVQLPITSDLAAVLPLQRSQSQATCEQRADAPKCLTERETQIFTRGLLCYD
jgi:hypothetical protein